MDYKIICGLHISHMYIVQNNNSYKTKKQSSYCFEMICGLQNDMWY